MQRQCGNKAISVFLQREGIGASPWKADCGPLPASPGMTGTGAPVTEQLRCPLQDN